MKRKKNQIYDVDRFTAITPDLLPLETYIRMIVISKLEENNLLEVGIGAWNKYEKIKDQIDQKIKEAIKERTKTVQWIEM